MVISDQYLVIANDGDNRSATKVVVLQLIWGFGEPEKRHMKTAGALVGSLNGDILLFLARILWDTYTGEVAWIQWPHKMGSFRSGTFVWSCRLIRSPNDEIFPQ